MERDHVMRWIVGIVAALAVVALLVWGDRDSGVDNRDTDPQDVQTSQTVDRA